MKRRRKEEGVTRKDEAASLAATLDRNGQEAATRWNQTRKHVTELYQSYYKKKGVRLQKPSEGAE